MGVAHRWLYASLETCSDHSSEILSSAFSHTLPRCLTRLRKRTLQEPRVRLSPRRRFPSGGKRRYLAEVTSPLTWPPCCDWLGQGWRR
eukprot:1176353-Prorocentrum_minimum.AAC.4